MNLLTVKNLYVRIEGKVIVENLSFKLGPSDRLSIVGPNGAGKTVLLKALPDLFNSKCRILKVAAEQIEEISPSVGLTKEVLATPVGHLSGGYFQRGLIGFALIGKPNVLLLDEPTASLDEPGEEHIYELIHRLQEQYKLAVITVSHDLSFVYRYASSVLCLNKQSVCIGPPQEVLTTEILEKLYGPSFSYYLHDHGDKVHSETESTSFR